MPPRRPRVPRSAERSQPAAEQPESAAPREEATTPRTETAARPEGESAAGTPTGNKSGKSHVSERLGRVASGTSKRASEAWNSTADRVAARRAHERHQVLHRARATAASTPSRQRGTASARNAGKTGQPGTAGPAGKKTRSSAPREVKPARSFSGHAVVLVLVLFISAIVVAPTLRVFLTQQSEISEIRADLESQSERQRELTRQLERWEDSAYVQQQARERFNMVMPGEKKYMVVGGQTEAEQNDEIVEVAAEPEEPAWAHDLWESLIVSAHR
ncbi:MAG: septum formation initiator family protein [Micrococcaceae bacterium]